MILTNHKISAFIFLALLYVGAVVVSVNAQSDTNDSGWSKTKEEREQRIAIAERDDYMIRQIYFSGNETIRDWEFRRRLSRHFNEGDIFKRKFLDNSIRNISKMQGIFPINADDIAVMLDPKNKDIDLTFIVRERPHN